MGNKSMTFERTIKAAAKDVYYHFTNSTGLRGFLSDSGVSRPHQDGYLFLTWNDGYRMQGTFEKLEEPGLIEFTWHGSYEPAATRVRVELSEQGGSTTVKLTHSEIGEDWGETVDEFRKGWEIGLENLQSVLETGIDLRIARRPMLGVITGPSISDENYQDFGLPKGSHGSQLDGIVEGMGAEAAGLVKGDVLLRLNGVTLEDFTSYATAIGSSQAGDEIEVVYWRDGQEHTVTMKLSARPLPDVPADPRELAARLREDFKAMDARLDELFAGATEEAASHPPAEGEWSAREVLCHLIFGERNNQSWLATLISGDEQVNFSNNIPALNEMILATYPTLADLRGELTRALAQTAALAAAIPAEFVAGRRGSYLRFGQALLQAGYHLDNHYAQIAAALEAALQPA